LDVLEQPRPDGVGSLGVHSFGGDPYWVSQMARAYIAGVHGGSGGRLATVARHFPGAGDADRLQEQEVATVQRSAEDLRRVALPPFLAVTRSASSVLNPNGEPAATDALMSSHIRYSGFQGSSLGRNTPISLAPELDMVLGQEGFAEWRAHGGLMVSNMLGAPAIRRYYDPTLAEFPYRRVATDAFSAGHDLLYLGRFSLDDRWESQKQNIKETIGYFQERYSRDRDFAAQVDAAVRRILRIKLSLYGVRGEAALPEPTADGAAPPVAAATVLADAADLAVLDEANRAAALAVVGEVARDSFSILYPDPASASDAASMTPQAGDRILIFTDSRLQRECEDCLAEAAVGPDELAAIIERLYGPTGTGQILPDQVNSVAFSDLAQLLDAEQTPEQAESDAGLAAATPVVPADALTATFPSTLTITPVAPPNAEAEPVDGAAPLLPVLDKNAKTDLLIEQADWILFAMLDVDATRYPTSDVVKQFLRQRGSQLANQHIAVLALHAPYFLDATEISKLNGYYAVYSKTQPFLESAVRALFRAFSPTGAPPVSVSGTRFGNLAERLQPDPAQRIDLVVSVPEGAVLIDTHIDSQSSLPEIDVGQVIRVQAGPVLDRNGKVVRNGTLVELRLSDDNESSAPVVETATTQNGLATRDLMVNRSGVVEISARAGQAVSPDEIALSVLGPANVPEALAPTAAISDTLGLTAAAVTTAGTTTQAVTAGEIALGDPAADGRRINLISLAVALLTMLAMSSLLLIVQVRVLPRQSLVHGILWAVNCGLVGYILYGLGLIPGGSWLENSLQVWGSGLVVFIAMLLPLVWLQLRAE
jgi:beta-N-acetylhexosaminidase